MKCLEMRMFDGYIFNITTVHDILQEIFNKKKLIFCLFAISTKFMLFKIVCSGVDVYIYKRNEPAGLNPEIN